jgi:prophage DNA circulation protein
MTALQAGRRRPVPTILLVLAALLCAVAVQLTAGRSAEAAGDHGSGHGQEHSTALPTAAQVAFHDQMRKLWEDHVTWTRLAIVTFADGSKGFDATAARLLQNQQDIGDAIKPYYGTAAGNQLTALLHDHITIAVELLQAARAGNDAAFQDANTRWYANANQIADFLSAANPRNWPDATMRAAMKTHLDQTLAEASAELQGNYPQSVASYDEIHQHILDMADLLSSGIIRQFPGRFAH